MSSHLPNIPFFGHCRTCGYPLGRLSEPRCPECGTPFNPDDPRTMDFLPSRTVAFLKKKSTPWTFFPAFVVMGATFAAILTNFYLTNALIILTFAILLPTLYIAMARTRFQSYLRSRRLPPPPPPQS